VGVGLFVEVIDEVGVIEADIVLVGEVVMLDVGLDVGLTEFEIVDVGVPVPVPLGVILAVPLPVPVGVRVGEEEAEIVLLAEIVDVELGVDELDALGAVVSVKLNFAS